jgi:hypothetical protein
MERIISCIFCVLIGAVGFWVGVRGLRNRKFLNQWKMTRGKVVERGIYGPDTPMLSAPAFRFAPLVRYAYQVDGKEFVNDCIHPKRIQLPFHSTRKWAQEKADSFPDEVTVHYNAADPAESYLVQTSRALLYTVVTISTLMIVVGLLVLAIM